MNVFDYVNFIVLFQSKLARTRARAGVHMIQFEKYALSAFTEEKINKFGPDDSFYFL